MSRVFLLSTNTAVDPHPVSPLGMAVVAGALAAAGHEVRQFDWLAAGRSADRLRDTVRAFDPDVVGLSLRNLDACDSTAPDGGWHLDEVQRLVAELRRATAAPIAVGGAAFSILPEEALAYLDADFGVEGEGERAFPALVEELGRGGRPEPLAPRQPPLEAGEVPAPLWDAEVAAFYREGVGHLNCQTKRGCPHRCAYCTYPSLEGSRLRCREPGAVADELERAAADLGVREFFFTDSVFNDGRGHYLEVAREILRRDLGIRFCALIRPQGLGREELGLLKAAGLRAAELGTDAASDAALAGLDKGFTFDDVLAVNAAFAAEEIPAAHFVVFGGPGETAGTVAEGTANLARLPRCVVFAFSGLRILPGTPLHRRAVAEGVLAEGAPLLRPAYYFSPDVEPEAMNGALEAAFRGRRDRLFPPAEAEARLAVMRRFGFKGLLWDRLLPPASAGGRAP